MNELPPKTARRRQGRTVRHGGRQSRLTERDLWLLDALRKMRFLMTGQIARLSFEGSRWAANKRLRKLLDAGMVRVWLRQLSEENVYSLDRAGARLLEDNAGDYEVLGAPRGLDGQLDHLLAINEFRIALAVGLESGDGEIRRWRSDWEFRAMSKQHIVPDALFSIHWGDAERTYVFEMDNKTRSVRGFLRKLLGYSSLLAAGGEVCGVSRPVVIVVCRDLVWLERYREALRVLPIGSQVWFAELEQARGMFAFGRIWKRSGDEHEYSLQELGLCPYGKEGEAALSLRSAGD